MNIPELMAKAQQMQEEMEKTKKAIAEKIIEAESGGGMVKVTMTGANQVRSIKISPELINPDDIEMLEDLVVAAVNKATLDAGKMAEEEMQKVSGMIPKIPGFDFGM